MNKYIIIVMIFALGIGALACVELIKYNSYRSITLDLEESRLIRSEKMDSIQEIISKRNKIPVTETNEAELLRYDNEALKLQRDVMEMNGKLLILQGESDQLIKYNILFKR